MSVFECVHPLTQAIIDFLEAHPSAAVKKLDESKRAGGEDRVLGR